MGDMSHVFSFKKAQQHKNIIKQYNTDLNNGGLKILLKIKKKTCQ